MGLFKRIKKWFSKVCCCNADHAVPAIDPIIPKSPVKPTIVIPTEEEKPWCKYGAKCYRKNPLHFQEFRHPTIEKLQEIKQIEKSPKVIELKTDSFNYKKTTDLPCGQLEYLNVKFQIDRINYISSFIYSFQCPCLKQRQLIINDIIGQVFSKENIVFDRRLSERVRKRPDWILRKETYILIIECDEKQHKHLSAHAELCRMIEIYQDVKLPCIFIRFNPDNFSNKGARDVCEFEKKDNMLVAKEPFQTRMNILLSRIEYHLTNKLLFNGITVEFLFFDTK